MSNKKYVFTDESITINDHTLHRIKAIRDFGNVKAGDLGGYIEKEENLSHDSLCWVYDNAQVYGDARVCGNAKIHINAVIKKSSDYLVIGPIGSRNSFTTFYNTAQGSIWVACGCFDGSIEDFKKRVLEVHRTSIFAKQYLEVIFAVQNIFNFQ